MGLGELSNHHSPTIAESRFFAKVNSADQAFTFPIFL
jgi:hypothetical protein